MITFFNSEDHRKEWIETFESKLDVYAECYEMVQQRLFGNAHLAIAAGEMYNCVREITDNLVYDTSSEFEV